MFAPLAPAFTPHGFLACVQIPFSFAFFYGRMPILTVSRGKSENREFCSADCSPKPRAEEKTSRSACADATVHGTMHPECDVPAFASVGRLAIVCGAMGALFLVILSLNLMHSHGNTFSVFYFAAKAVADGADIYRSHSPGSNRFEYVYPPLFAVLMVPLTHFKLMTATRIWTLIDAFLTVLALTLASSEAVRRFQLPSTNAVIAAIAAGGFLLGVGEIKTELATSQTDTLVLISFVLALLWLDEWPMLCGLALGFSCNIKYQTLITLPYLLLTRRWKAAASTAVSSVGFALLPGLVVGFSRNLQYLRSAFHGLGHFAGFDIPGAASTVSLTWIRSVSITSAIGRLLDCCGISSSYAFLLAPLVGLVCVALARQLYQRHGIAMLPPRPSILPGINSVKTLVAVEWTGLMVSWLVFGPEVSRRHMYVLLLMHVIAVTLLFRSKGRERLLLIAGMLVCQVGLRIPSGPAFGPVANVFNAVGGPSWCLLLFYGALLNSDLTWLREVSGKPMPDLSLRTHPAIDVDRIVRGTGNIPMRAPLTVSPD